MNKELRWAKWTNTSVNVITWVNGGKWLDRTSISCSPPFHYYWFISLTLILLIIMWTKWTGWRKRKRTKHETERKRGECEWVYSPVLPAVFLCSYVSLGILELDRCHPWIEWVERRERTNERKTGGKSEKRTSTHDSFIPFIPRVSTNNLREVN